MSDTHLAGPQAQLRFMAWVLGAATAIGFLVLVMMDSWLFLMGVAVAWAVLLVYFLLFRGVVSPLGEAFGRVLVPSGSSTPSVNQHSNIEALVARGDFTKAAEAYQAVIAADPGDVVACERLAQLALGDLKDYDLALFAVREGEKRTTNPRRQAGFALLAANICRDNLKDYGKAMVELRRVLALYPDVPNAARLRAEIEELRALHFKPL